MSAGDPPERLCGSTTPPSLDDPLTQLAREVHSMDVKTQAALQRYVITTGVEGESIDHATYIYIGSEILEIYWLEIPIQVYII